MQLEERLVRELLRDNRAEFVRKSGRGHEVWRLPGVPGQIVFGNNGTSYRVWKKTLCDIRRALRALPAPALQGVKATAVVIDDAAEFQRSIDQVAAKPPEEDTQVLSKETKTEKTSPFGVPWTDRQTEGLKHARAAGMSMDEIAEYMQEFRPGLTPLGARQKISKLTRAGVIPRRGEKTPAPVVASLPPVDRLLPKPVEPPARRVESLEEVKVTFELGGKRRTVLVDRGTANNWLREAVEL